jgi:tRNA (guanine-N7-)-methyltransferase
MQVDRRDRVESLRGGSDASGVPALASPTDVSLSSLVETLDLEKIFGRVAPLQIDLGCGDGAFLCALASENPQRNFLGVEKLAGRVAKTCRKSAHLTNVRVLNIESVYAVRYLLPEASVETFYLLFPDPWPKRRHHRRRLVTSDFLAAVHRALEPNGILRIATDDLDYFQQIKRVVRDPSFELLVDDDWALPMTKFERRFRATGVPIYRFSLRKVSPVR